MSGNTKRMFVKQNTVDADFAVKSRVYQTKLEVPEVLLEQI